MGNGVYDEGEVYINKATTIDLLTGSTPNYLTLDYDVFKNIDNSQFWRKFLNQLIHIIKMEIIIQNIENNLSR